MHILKNQLKNTLDPITYAFINEISRKYNIQRAELINTWNNVSSSYKKYNRGELDEITLVHNLFNLNESKDYDTLSKCLTSEADNGIELFNVENKKQYKDPLEITKTSSSYKADIGIKMIKTNNIYYASIKSSSASNYAILNHTHRMAKIFQGGVLNKHLLNLDILINEYISKRNSNIIKEDVRLIDLVSLSNINVKNSIVEVLKYFIFRGTGKGDSQQPANSILIYNNGDILFEKYNTESEQIQYTYNILPKCIMSLRHKGMPKNINEKHQQWIFNTNNKQKGCLHIRVNNAL